VIAAILLAAGHARRFGADKLVQDLNGKPVIRRSVEVLCGPPIGDVLVVVPSAHEAIAQALAGLSVRLVVNDASSEGMASSIVCGVKALGPDTEATLIALADEPTLRRAVVQGVVDRYRAGQVSIVAPRYHGIPGHPVLFDRTVFGELSDLRGDAGARSVIDRDARRVAILELDETRPVDVDTPADLEHLRSATAR
jgi:molybdenum cofactor cytidylyltransferase